MSSSEEPVDLYLNAIEELCQILTRTESPATEWFDKFYETVLDKDFITLQGFKSETEVKSVMSPLLPRLFDLLRECLLTHRWSAALDMVQNITPIPAGSNYTSWKVGCELLGKDGAESSDLMEQLYNNMKLCCDLNSKEVVMDFLVYLLRFEDCTEATIKMQEKYRKSGVKKDDYSDYMNKCHTAYLGLLWYLEWKKKCQDLEEYEQDLQHCEPDNRHDQRYRKQLLVTSKTNYQRKAVKCFTDLQNVKGIWDIFVRRHVELLIDDGNFDKAFEVLKDYHQQNQENLNSHKYLYDFCKKYMPENEDTISYDILKNIADMSPSDELVLQYCLHLIQQDNVFLATKYLVKMLDYACWQYKVQPWKMFAKCLYKIKHSKLRKQKSKVEDIEKFIETRKSWWPSYHFTKYTAQQGKDVPELNFNKACAAISLYGNDCEFIAEANNHLDESERTVLQDYLQKHKT